MLYCASTVEYSASSGGFRRTKLPHTNIFLILDATEQFISRNNEYFGDPPLLTRQQRDGRLGGGRASPALHAMEPDMTDLNAYLDEKRDALKARQARIEDGSLG